MAIRQIRKYGDDILRKKCRKVETVNDRMKTLLDDMLETMYINKGVGLAAPQVGILRRAIVVDVGEGAIKLVNPEIMESEGSQIDYEGCLSIPGASGKVDRPQRIKVKAIDENGKEIVFEKTGYFARALCHEIDHLDGTLFIDKEIKEEQ